MQKHERADAMSVGAEYNSQWRDDLATFIGRDLLVATVDRGVIVRPPIDGTKYFAFADPSGGAHDSFTLGVSHREQDGSIVLELPARWNGAP